MATDRILHCCSQSASAIKSRVNVPNRRTESMGVHNRQHPSTQSWLAPGLAGHRRLLLLELRPGVTSRTNSRTGSPHEADVTTDLYVTSDPRLTTGSASAPMSTPGCSRMLQRIQYALLLFIPSLLGRPIKCLAFKQSDLNPRFDPSTRLDERVICSRQVRL
jgi:hypothetical protein